MSSYEQLKNLKLETTKESFTKIHYVIAKDLQMLMNKAGASELTPKDVSKIKYYTEALKVIQDKTEDKKEETTSITLNFSEVTSESKS